MHGRCSRRREYRQDEWLPVDISASRCKGDAVVNLRIKAVQPLNVVNDPLTLRAQNEAAKDAVNDVAATASYDVFIDETDELLASLPMADKSLDDSVRRLFNMQDLVTLAVSRFNSPT